MRNALAIIRSDVAEKQFVFWTALALSFAPFVLMIVPALRGHSTAAMVGNVVAVTFVLAVTIGLGSTMIGSDLSAGRLSFYFAKPMSAASLWYGKLVAALVIVYGSLAIVATPAALYAWNDRGGWIEVRNVILTLAGMAPVLLLVVHIISTFFRARSIVLAVDAMAFAIAIAAAWYVVRQLNDAATAELQQIVGGSAAAALMITLVAAGGWQLSRGRTDRHANHVALSKFLWVSVSAVLVAAGAFVVWTFSVHPADITGAEAFAAPNGTWAVVSGLSPRGKNQAAFVLNVSDGSFYRVSSADFVSGTIFSRDGRTVAWTHGLREEDVIGGRPRKDMPVEIYTRDLAGNGAARATGIVTSVWSQLTLSDDGSRLATLSHGIVNVADSKSGRSLGSVRVDAKEPAATMMFFASNDVLRLYVSDARVNETAVSDLTLHILEYDVRRRVITQTGSVPSRGRFLSFAASEGGDRLLIVTANPESPADAMFTADARTGARIATMPAVSADSNRRAALLDHSIVTLFSRGDHIIYRQLGFDGRTLNDIDLGPGAIGFVSGAVPSRMIVTVAARDRGPRQWRTIVVDTARNAVVADAARIRPAHSRMPFDSDPRSHIAHGPMVAAIDASGRVVRLDITTGTVTPLPR